MSEKLDIFVTCVHQKWIH